MNTRIKKYFDGILNQSEKTLLLKELDNDKSLKDEFIMYRNLLGLVALSERKEDKEEGADSYQHFMKLQQRKNIRKLFGKITSYAAAIIMLIGGTYITSTKLNEVEIRETFNTLYVPVGQRANITLSDGTNVWVNANSSIVYPSAFTSGERRITLVGEAFFQVAKDSENPFIVSTKDIEVNVLGTTFNVNSYPQDKQSVVCLIEGSVEVSVGKEKYILTLGEQLINTDGVVTLSNFYDENNFSWKDGIYTFEQVPLFQIVHKLELYYGVKIDIEKSSLSEVLFTGKFRQRDGIVEILRILQTAHPFQIEKDENNNIITLK